MLARLLFDRFEKNAVAPVAFDRARCLRSRLNTNSCDRCLAVCNHGAIKEIGRTIEFNAEKCTGCMVCVSECSNEAFSCGFDPAALITAVRRFNEGKPFSLGCRKTTKNTETSIPCLGILSEPMLAAINSLAIQDFFLDVRSCADCQNGAVFNFLQKRIQGIIRRTGNSSCLKIRYKYESDVGDMSVGQDRRFFLKSLKKKIASIGIDAAAKEGILTDTAQPSEHNTKKASKIGILLREVLDMVPEGDAAKRKLLYSYFYSLTCSEACTLCPSCTGMCPTGALKRKTETEKKQLCFTSKRCNGCGLCVEFCKKKALTLQPGITDANDTESVIAVL